MRHAQAVPSDYRTTDDARWLTAAGRRMAGDAGRALYEHRSGESYPEIDLIVHSPLVRAVQTAEIVASCLSADQGWSGELVSLEALRSERPAQAAIEDLEAFASRAILAVSHEPIVSAMSGLLSGQGDGDFRAAFKTAEMRLFFAGARLWAWRS